MSINKKRMAKNNLDRNLSWVSKKTAKLIVKKPKKIKDKGLTTRTFYREEFKNRPFADLLINNQNDVAIQ